MDIFTFCALLIGPANKKVGLRFENTDLGAYVDLSFAQLYNAERPWGSFCDEYKKNVEQCFRREGDYRLKVPQDFKKVSLILTSSPVGTIVRKRVILDESFMPVKTDTHEYVSIFFQGYTLRLKTSSLKEKEDIMNGLDLASRLIYETDFVDRFSVNNVSFKNYSFPLKVSFDTFISVINDKTKVYDEIQEWIDKNKYNEALKSLAVFTNKNKDFYSFEFNIDYNVLGLDNVVPENNLDKFRIYSKDTGILLGKSLRGHYSLFGYGKHRFNPYKNPSPATFYKVSTPFSEFDVGWHCKYERYTKNSDMKNVNSSTTFLKSFKESKIITALTFFNDALNNFYLLNETAKTIPPLQTMELGSKTFVYKNFELDTSIFKTTHQELLLCVKDMWKEIVEEMNSQTDEVDIIPKIVKEGKKVQIGIVFSL